jgi:hypothetical protein
MISFNAVKRSPFYHNGDFTLILEHTRERYQINYKMEFDGNFVDRKANLIKVRQIENGHKMELTNLTEVDTTHWVKNTGTSYTTIALFNTSRYQAHNADTAMKLCTRNATLDDQTSYGAVIKCEFPDAKAMVYLDSINSQHCEFDVKDMIAKAGVVWPKDTRRSSEVQYNVRPYLGDLTKVILANKKNDMYLVRKRSYKREKWPSFNMSTFFRVEDCGKNVTRLHHEIEDNEVIVDVVEDNGVWLKIHERPKTGKGILKVEALGGIQKFRLEDVSGPAIRKGVLVPHLFQLVYFEVDDTQRHLRQTVYNYKDKTKNIYVYDISKIQQSASTSPIYAESQN